VISFHDAEPLEELVARCQQGDDKAFAVLVGQLDQYLRDVIARRGIPDADVEDVASEVWIKVWRSIRLFDFHSNFKTWLHRVAVNASIDDHRRRSRRPLPAPRSLFEEKIDPDATAEHINDDVSSEIFHALEALTPHQREAVLLVDGDGLSLVDAAHVLGLNYKTFASRLSRGRSALKARLPAIRRSLSSD
jgi:RNA polymerase sigma-70 factor, ECF subfamily